MLVSSWRVEILVQLGRIFYPLHHEKVVYSLLVPKPMIAISTQPFSTALSHFLYYPSVSAQVKTAATLLGIVIVLNSHTSQQYICKEASDSSW